jgi:hypothetical protein
MDSTSSARPSFTVDEWCRHRKVCRATFHNLQKRGGGPKIMRVGRRVTISAEANEEWRRAHEAAAETAQ